MGIEMDIAQGWCTERGKEGLEGLPSGLGVVLSVWGKWSPNDPEPCPKYNNL